MKDWVREQVESARERQLQAARKLSCRELDAQVLRIERPRFWESLVTAVCQAVADFNGEMSLSAPLEFDARGRCIHVTKPDFPYMCVLYFEYREVQSDIEVSLTLTQKPGMQSHTVKETMPFEVVDGGSVGVISKCKLARVDCVAAYWLPQIFRFVGMLPGYFP